MMAFSLRRNDSRTAFLIHWCCRPLPDTFASRDAQAAGVEFDNDMLDGITHFGGSAGRVHTRPVFPGLIDGAF
jgi:hypothetical protein